MTDKTRDALAVLVALKDLEEKFRALHRAGRLTPAAYNEALLLEADYNRNQSIAWNVARAILSEEAPQPESQHRMDLYSELAEALGCDPMDSHEGRLRIARESLLARRAQK